MSKVIIGVGIPGSGKTTALLKLAQEYSYTYICPDNIRQELTGNAADQSKNREVWEEAYQRTADALKKGESIVFDATFANEGQRKDFIKFTKDNGAEKVQGIYAEATLELAKERNRNRERIVPEHAIDRMYESFQQYPPTIEDGFDSLFTIDQFQQLQHTEIRKEDRTLSKEFRSAKLQ